MSERVELECGCVYTLVVGEAPDGRQAVIPAVDFDDLATAPMFVDPDLEELQEDLGLSALNQAHEYLREHEQACLEAQQ